VQGLLASVEQQDVELQAILAAELDAYHPDLTKVEVSGPSVPLPPTSAQAIALTLHELATNAVKYGAFAQPTGRLNVSWKVEADDQSRKLKLEWRESGVPISPSAPRRRGYGSELIERALPYQLGAQTDLRFTPEGVACRIIVPIRAAQ
jgi:two-component sensor histidine kinase